MSIDSSLRILQVIPVESLWRPDGRTDGLSRLRQLGRADIQQLLREGPVEFVHALLGRPFVWTPLGDGYALWKREVRPHLVEVGAQRDHDAFPGGYCFVASQWSEGRDGPVVVLLEPYH